MDKEIRNAINTATQRARKLLEDDFSQQLEGVFDVNLNGTIAEEPGEHLDDVQRVQRAKLVTAVEHHLAAGMTKPEAVAAYLREAAFTTLNRFVALKMLEARGLVQECITSYEQSSGFKEFGGLAPGLVQLLDHGYRLYVESLFDELSVHIRVLFNRRDAASLLWPRRACLENLLAILNAQDLANVWAEDETIGWIYQYYNDDAERKKMREESSAPRNSHELAVRNQFFTPRYVVEFLTDNTLGRLWYEMRQGQTALKEQCRYMVRRPTEIFLRPGEAVSESPNHEGLTQEELLRQAVHIPHRAPKDPREIRLLDPACGSMHFGLYAFDLFTVIYDEAWEIACGPDAAAKSAETFAPFVAFVATFPDKAAFLREVPRLIIERNIHGIDIDPRATQIAGLSLWLRAQRAWHQAGVEPADRPRITRSNLVCAEPMPGEKELLREFVEQQFPAGEQTAFAFLLETIFDRMTLAGEAGSLLRIDVEIRNAIADAKQLWKQGPKSEQASLFPEPVEKDGEGELRLDLSGITDEQFWERAEQRIYDALEAYAEQAENGGGFQRRLFADDAAQGFAFIDLRRKRYDVVVMNPPFGDASRNAKSYIDNAYPLSKGNLLANFVELGARSLVKHGRLGAIVSRTCFFLRTFSGFRATVLKNQLRPKCFADLGSGVLDAMVETAATVFEKSPSAVEPAVFFRQLTTVDKGEGVLKGVRLLQEGQVIESVFLALPQQFELLAEAPYVYWINRQVAEKLASKRMIDPDACSIRVGLQTGDDFRFLRLWHEIPPTDIASMYLIGDKANIRKACLEEVAAKKSWAWYSKIDQASPFVAPIHLCVNWRFTGAEIKAYHEGNGHSASKYVMSEDHYFKPGFSYMLRSSRLVPYIVPHAVIPTAGRSQVYPKDKHLDWLLILLGANVASAVARFRGENFGQPKFQNTMVGSVPFIDSDPVAAGKGMGIIKKRIKEFSKLYSSDESAIQFVLFDERSGLHASPDFDRRSLLGFQLDQEIASLFGFSPREFELLQRDLMESVTAPNSVLEEGADEALTSEVPGVASDTPTRLISYSFGCVFGRWDIRYATGERPAPELPDPFAPLPACPPGMLQGGNGLPLSPEAGRRLRAEGRYPLDVAWDGILVDDPEHALDIERRVHDALAIIWGDRKDPTLQDACDLLGVTRLRDWFRKPACFFADHLSRSSKSRRQAPIYWPVSTPAGRYTVWLYYHRFNKDTLYRALELVREKLDYEDRKLQRMMTDAGSTPGSGERKAIADHESFVGELRTLHDELSRVAPLWNPNLNDGVILNYGPLWRMIGHKPWQKKVKAKWAELVKGKYDWANLAMHLWPERVVPKCAKDRSLAIAHGLDEVFWQDDAKGKPQPRKVAQAEIDELVRERASATVKAALKGLLEAPAPAGSKSKNSGTGVRKRKSAKFKA